MGSLNACRGLALRALWAGVGTVLTALCHSSGSRIVKTPKHAQVKIGGERLKKSFLFN